MVSPRKHLGAPSPGTEADPPRVGVNIAPELLAPLVGKKGKLLGSGGFGRVFQGSLPSVGKVAVKVAKQKGEAVLAHEIEVLQRVQHPNCVQVIGTCWSPTIKAIVYEFVPAGTLDLYLDPEHPVQGRKRPLTWQDRIKITYQVASVLSYMHNSHPHILHRDVKPSNILLDDHHNAKLADVGIAKLVEEDTSEQCLKSGRAGTRDYLDPLYAQLGQLCDRSDMYSLGVTMCQLLLDSPDPTASRNVVRHAVSQRELHLPEALKSWPLPLAMQYADLATRCSAQDRAKRLQAVELCDALWSLWSPAGSHELDLQPGHLALAHDLGTDEARLLREWKRTHSPCTSGPNSPLGAKTETMGSPTVGSPVGRSCHQGLLASAKVTVKNGACALPPPHPLAQGHPNGHCDRSGASFSRTSGAHKMAQAHLGVAAHLESLSLLTQHATGALAGAGKRSPGPASPQGMGSPTRSTFGPSHSTQIHILDLTLKGDNTLNGELRFCSSTGSITRLVVGGTWQQSSGIVDLVAVDDKKGAEMKVECVYKEGVLSVVHSSGQGPVKPREGSRFLWCKFLPEAADVSAPSGVPGRGP